MTKLHPNPQNYHVIQITTQSTPATNPFLPRVRSTIHRIIFSCTEKNPHEAPQGVKDHQIRVFGYRKGALFSLSVSSPSSKIKPRGGENMCSKSSLTRQRKRAAKEEARVLIPARKTRSKTRKPKYLSLKLELSPKTKTPQKSKTQMTHSKQLKNLFPLHPENLVQQYKDMHEHDQVAFLLETASTDDTSTTLQGLLDTTTSEDGPLSCYIENDQERCDHGRASLLERTAMKCKERDLSDERWVSYWEVVEKKEQEEVSSSSCNGVADTPGKMLQAQDDNKNGLVGLKLDYQEILNAWSDKGPLYIEGESPQTVPDIYDGSNQLMDEWGSLWRVPDMCGSKTKEGKEIWKSGQREASVLRYKEKRQNRLFAKRIRYEVRKLNAEKRPRLKGRFVKRSWEM